MIIYGMLNGVTVNFNDIVFEGNKTDAKKFLNNNRIQNCYFCNITGMYFMTTRKLGFLSSRENPMED